MYLGPNSNQAKLKVKKTVASGEIKPTISLNLLCWLKYHGENAKDIYFIQESEWCKFMEDFIKSQLEELRKLGNELLALENTNSPFYALNMPNRIEVEVHLTTEIMHAKVT